MSQPSYSSQSNTGHNIVLWRFEHLTPVEKRGARERVILRFPRISSRPKDVVRRICIVRGASGVDVRYRRCQNDNTFSPLSFDSVILVCYGAEVGKFLSKLRG